MGLDLEKSSRFVVLAAWMVVIGGSGVAEGEAARSDNDARPLRAGAAVVDVTPTTLPVIVNGMFEERTAASAHDALQARAIVLEDGRTSLAIVVVDSCMLPRELIDEAKRQAARETGIAIDHMLVSATHTHSAPSAMGCLGSDADSDYARFLTPRIAQAITVAQRNLVPARIGWTLTDAPDQTHCRRWIWRSDRLRRDPFGELSVHAMMHPGYQNPDAISSSGPVDSGLSLVSIQSLDGKPLALLANYAMHYFDSPLLSSDYYGVFREHFAKAIGAGDGDRPFVAIMSQGTSGDQYWVDYSQPQKRITIDPYTDAIVRIAKAGYDKIEYHDRVPLEMRESKLTLRRRVPDEKRLAWARQTFAKLDDRRKPTALPEVYAREQLLLAVDPVRELKLQAIRIGDLGIVAIPDEVFGLTGLKLRARSPLKPSFVIELANGSEGYIPPPEQHVLGGYTTWAARTAGLETQAEPKILDASLKLLEQVSAKPRQSDKEIRGAYAQAVRDSKPVAYWPLDEMNGPRAEDASGSGHPANYEDGVVFYLDGPRFSTPGEAAHAAHFAGGRVRAGLRELGTTWSAELWFWNGMPNNVRPVTAYLLSRGPEGAEGAPGDHLGIGGTSVAPGKLLFFTGNATNQVLPGSTDISLRSWNHVVLVREGKHVRVYLNGNAQPEIEGEAPIRASGDPGPFFLGGRSDNFANLEGRMCQAALYDRALSAEEVVAHYKASGMPPRPLIDPNAPTAPLSPEESLGALHVRDGFEAELVAAEPLVRDPIAIAWGADGKLWVVEMADYPTGIDGHMRGGGRVRYLESTHNDGRYDKSTIFLDGLNFPTGVIPWRKGVIVTAAPEIIYAEDTDGGGKATFRKTLYRGFKEGNTQLRVNGLRWGMDGWLYCANGWSGGVARSELTGQQVDLSGHDFRIKPDEGLIELQSGMTEFGRDCDNEGNWFGCDNSNPLFHFPFDDRYPRRNPHVAPPADKIQLEVPVNPKVYARSQPQKRYHTFEHSDHFTSACGMTIYRDDLVFASGLHAFTCEPVHNLVHHEIVSESGVSFTAARPPEEQDSEFLASTDQWFRPVMTRTGPDGALWVVDMYRYVIEHPDWLPEQGKRELAKYWRLGSDRGRIYRVYPKGQHPREMRRMDHLTLPDLVAALASASSWERDTAQQVLAWSGDRAAIPLVQSYTTDAMPAARTGALWTLHRLGGLRPEHVEAALADRDPSVRRQALRLAESLAGESPRLVDAAARLVDDPDAKVRLQLAFTLGEWNTPIAGSALGRLTVKDIDDPSITGAVMSSAVHHYEAIAAALRTSGRAAPQKLMDDLFSTALGVGDRDAIARLLASFDESTDGQYTPEQMTAFGGWLDALSQHRQSMKQLGDSAHDALSERLGRTASIFEAARSAASNASFPTDQRLAAVPLLGRQQGAEEQDVRRLVELTGTSNALDLQLGAVRALGKIDNPRVPEALIASWGSHSPEVRRASIDVLMAREPWTWELLRAIEAGKVSDRALDLPRRQRLLEHGSARVQALAKKVLGGAADPSRQKIVDDYLPALALAGDAKHGQTVFAQNCATCHRIGNVGQEIGPNLRSVSGWTEEAMLVAILDPNRQVEPRYLSFTATLSDGEAIFGVITNESAASMTMKGLDGKERTILRGSLKSLVGTNRSLMPDGLEAALSKQDLADVIRFVQTATSEPAS